MNTIIKNETVNFKTLVTTNCTNTNLNFQSKIIDELNNTFTDEEQKWYIASLYVYLNYHPINDFPINLDDVYKLIGFVHKKNAKLTLINNFTENEDYKISSMSTKDSNSGVFIPRDENLSKDLGGRLVKDENVLLTSKGKQKKENLTSKGKKVPHGNNEIIMLNVDTFKNICMITKTEKAKQIRKYYVKLENIFNKLINEEYQQHQLQLQEKEQLLKESEHTRLLLEQDKKEKEHKLELLTRKTNKYELGDSIYIFHSTSDDGKDVYKIGKTKNLNRRETHHKTSSFKGALEQIKCVDSTLLERSVHFVLNKYRIVSNREWFDVSLTTMKNAIYYTKLVLESNINFETHSLIEKTESFIKEFQIPEIKDETEEPCTSQEQNHDIFTEVTHIPKLLTDYQSFFNDCCISSPDKNVSVSHALLKNVFKIWSKKATHACLKNMIDFFKLNFITVMLKHNPLVSTSKYTPHFRGILIKKSFYEFDKPDSNNKIIERFLYERCIKSPNYRISMQEVFTDFQEFYKNIKETNNTVTHIMQEKIKNYLYVYFIRLRSGESNLEKDTRLNGWFGFTLKNKDNPEHILNYKPKNAKHVEQVNVSTGDVFKTWSSLTDLAGYLKKSRTVTSQIVTRHEQINIDGVFYIFNRI